MTEEEKAKMVREFAELRKTLTGFDSRLARLEAIGPPDQQVNLRTRFQENGNWARHYSTVRMTTTTFLVGVSLGILSFRWPATAHPRIPFIALSGIVWMLAVALFLVFTRLTYREMESARRKRNLLPDGISDVQPDAYHPRQDPASWIVAFLTLFYGWLLLYLGNVWLWHFSFPTGASYFKVMGCAVPGCVLFIGLAALLWTGLQPAFQRTVRA